MISFSTARSNRALAIALVALVKAHPKRTKRGRPRKNELTGKEYREVEAVKAMVRHSANLNSVQERRILARIDATCARG